MQSQSESSQEWTTIEAIIWYGLGVLVLAGGAGAWLPLILPGKTVGSDGLATYVFAVLAPLMADAVLIEPYWKRLSKTVRVRLYFLCTLAASFAVIALVRDGKDWDLTAGLVGAILSLFVWFLTVKYSRRFEPDEKTPPTGSLGGSNVTSQSLGGGGLQ